MPTNVDDISRKLSPAQRKKDETRAGQLLAERGGGNVFRNLGHENVDEEQCKPVLAGEIIKALDRESLSVRAAHGRTGIAAADFSHIRNADLDRFTDRLMSIINRLGSPVEVKVGCGALERSKWAAR